MNYELDAIMHSRPPADHAIEQFLMTPESVEIQLERVGPFLQNRSVFFLGDDDHISPLLAREYDSRPYVYEYDKRIRANLDRWFKYFQLQDAQIYEYDVRNKIEPRPFCDSFYINPPYSAKSSGLGIKIWLMRAIEACVDDCWGVIVMPRRESNIHTTWVGDVEYSVDEFITANGFVILHVDEGISNYADTNDQNLKSSNVYVQRVNPSRFSLVDLGDIYN